MDTEIEQQIHSLQTYMIITVATAGISALQQVWNHVRRSKCTSGCCSFEIENEEEKILQAANIITKRRASRDDSAIINMPDNVRTPLMK